MLFFFFFFFFFFFEKSQGESERVSDHSGGWHDCDGSSTAERDWLRVPMYPDRSREDVVWAT